MSYVAEQNEAEGIKCNLVQPNLPKYLRIRPFWNCVPKSTNSHNGEFEHYSEGMSTCTNIIMR
ncbi:hypothetical protein ZOSMA_157G00180 [Zostera marina]|uniref:Uncharacterized protein n=1 Tax=Zostera marina TaxID=29655 RepID=A0A0K9PXH3_ZOSMR|nr:hypothetical protein ZOSMA_157G00180 [Zostera marina]